MQTLIYSEIREKRLVSTMDNVCNNHEPVVITRRDGKPVVMLALADYEALSSRPHESAPPIS